MNRIYYFKNIRKGKIEKPETAFEENYLICFLFKKLFKNRTVKEKLERLIELSKVKIIGNPQKYDLRRKKIHRSHKKCFICGKISSCQHHIILLKNGGYDNGINRIPICSDCHKIIHPWLI